MDYLEALLELEQEQQEQAGLDWPARPVTWAAWDKAGNGTQGQLQQEWERGNAYDQTQPEEQTRRQGVVWLTQRLRQLRGTAERARQQRKSLATQAAHDHGTAPWWTGSKPTLRGAVDYAAVVDAAFQRDARRYDGQLGLL